MVWELLLYVSSVWVSIDLLDVCGLFGNVLGGVREKVASRGRWSLFCRKNTAFYTGSTNSVSV